MPIRLPPGYSVEDGKTVRHWSDKRGDHAEVVADGTFEVIKTIQYNDAPDQLFVAVRFTNSNETWHEVVLIPVKQTTGSGKKLLDFVPDWFVLLGTSPTKRLSFVQQTLNLQRAGIEEVIKIQRVGMGYHVSAKGTLFYVLGRQVINQPADEKIETTSPFHLRADQRRAYEPPGQSIAWSRKFCEQGPPQAALFVAALTAYIRPILKATNNLDRLGVYVVGESGTGKSSTAKLLCQLFKEESGATLSSDKSDIFRLMSTYRDMPFLIDDLNDSRIASAMNKKKERLSEILQQLSSTGVLAIRGETFNVGLTTPIVTAERLLNSHSSINRTLIIAYEKPFDADTMTWLQEHRNFYVDFLAGFICWICQHHSRLSKCVQSWNLSNPNVAIKKPDAIVGLPRLMRTFAILKIALELFLLHLREIYAVPQEDETSWRRLLEEGVNQAVFTDTLNQLRRENTEQERFFVDAVLDIFDEDEQQYKAKDKRVAASYEKYVEFNRQARIDGRIPRKLFFLSSDKAFYRFRGDDLVAYLTEKHGGQCRASKKAISAQLNNYGLLRPSGIELSYPVVEDSEHHYYSLRLDMVEEMRENRRKELHAAVDRALVDGGDIDYDMSRFVVKRR